MPKLIEYVMDPNSDLLPQTRSVLKVLTEALQLLDEKVAVLDKESAQGRGRTHLGDGLGRADPGSSTQARPYSDQSSEGLPCHAGG